MQLKALYCFQERKANETQFYNSLTTIKLTKNKKEQWEDVHKEIEGLSLLTLLSL